MSRNVIMFGIAGAALSLGTTAFAQNSDIDRAYESQLLADAEQRSSLLQSGGGAGNDGYFYIVDSSGNYRLNIQGLLQFRYTAGFREDDGTLVTGDDDFTHGFSTPRSQIRFFGNIINPNITYRVSFDFGNSTDGVGQGAVLRDAYGQYNFEGEGRGFYARWGQFKLPILTEESVAPEFQLAADRSITNEFFTPDYSQAVMVGYVSEGFAIHAAASDGVQVPFTMTNGTSNTFYNSANEADIGLTARADIKFAGDWERFDDFTSFRGSDFAARLGGAFHWQSSGDTNPSTPTVLGAATDDYDYYMWTVDASIEGDGWNLYGAYMGHTLDGEFAAGGDFDVTNHGVVVQGGLFLTDGLEAFARYDALFFDDDLGLSEDDYNFLTFGVNYYFLENSHSAKFTLDAVWSFEETTDLVSTGVLPNQSTGLLGNAEDDEILIRAQVQLLF